MLRIPFPTRSLVATSGIGIHAAAITPNRPAFLTRDCAPRRFGKCANFRARPRMSERASHAVSEHLRDRWRAPSERVACRAKDRARWPRTEQNRRPARTKSSLPRRQREKRGETTDRVGTVQAPSRRPCPWPSRCAAYSRTASGRTLKPQQPNVCLQGRQREVRVREFFKLSRRPWMADRESITQVMDSRESVRACTGLATEDLHRMCKSTRTPKDRGRLGRSGGQGETVAQAGGGIISPASG